MRRRVACKLIAVLPKIKACANTCHVQPAGLLNRRLIVVVPDFPRIERRSRRGMHSIEGHWPCNGGSEEQVSD